MPYTPYQRTDNGVSTVAGGSGGLGTPLNPSDTTLRLPTGDGAKYPATAPFMLYLGGSELAKATLRSSDTVTISRAQEGTSASTWPVGTSVELVETAGTLANTDTALQHLLSGVYNIRDYGAVGDGVTDDGVALRSALSAIQAAGYGALYLPAGVYNCGVGANAENGSFLACGFIPPNCTVFGDGIEATKILLRAGVTSGSKMMMNWHIQSGGDSNITIRDLTLDGNSPNQTFTSGCRGLHVMRMRHLRATRVRFKDMYGTGGGTTESTATTVDFCADCSYIDCEAYGSGVAPISDTGFAANFCNNINYVGCVARGLGGGGFTSSYCSGMLHTNCYSFNNGTYGFNDEQPQGNRYVSCHSGDSASLRSSWGYNQGQRLGNGSHGFVVLGGTDTLQNPQFAPTLTPSGSGGTLAAGVWTVAFTYVTGGGETQIGPTVTATTTGTTSSIAVTIPKLPPDSATGWNIYVSSAVNGATLLKSNGVLQTGTSYTITAAGAGAATPASNTATYTITVSVSWDHCTSNYNGGSGVNLSTLTGGFARLLWSGGELIGNGSYGASGGGGDWLSVVGHPVFANNSPANMRSASMDHDAYGGLMTPGPAVPASGTELLNPYMIPAVVAVTGGTVSAIAKGRSGAEVTVAAATPAIVPLGAGEYIKLTYTVAPTWVWSSNL